MSSKNAQSQGRRTPLTLNPQAKSVQQQPQHNKQQAETRSKQSNAAQQKLQEKKETVNNAFVASAAGPVPVEKNASKQQQNMRNGFNNGTESKANTNGSNNNKAAVEDSKKESETRSKPAQPAEEQQQVKNGADVAAKSAFGNSSSNGQRKQQQQKQSPQAKQQQVQQQQHTVVEKKVENTAKSEEAVVIVVDDEKVEEKKIVAAASPTKQAAAATGKKEEEVKNATPPKLAAGKKEQEAKSATPTKPTTASSSPSTKKTPVKKYTATTTIDVEPMDASPIKSKTAAIENPNATSTPGQLTKIRGSTKEPLTPIADVARVASITGRRSIRALTDWTPSKFDNNPQFRESYRRIKTDLDLSDTSMNVTVGSEPGNNTSWFSFRSRKRERTPPTAENLQVDVLSPPKRARFGILSIMASPFTALRSRFSRASIKPAPVLQEEEEDDEENNVSMGEEISIIDFEEDTPASKNDSPVKKDIPVDEAKPVEFTEKDATKKDILEIGVQAESTSDECADDAKNERCNMM